jgi:hypothetical protein
MSVYGVEEWDVTEGSRRHTAHVVPISDFIDHAVDADGDCICGPRTVPVATTGGGFGWMYFHHSLDGRELS